MQNIHQKGQHSTTFKNMNRVKGDRRQKKLKQMIFFKRDQSSINVWRDISPGLCLDWGPESAPNLFSGARPPLAINVLQTEN